ncbi:hypothetical protein [Paenibacillus turpanensis]|uniref:hypothetical protein n=1 Tax=Paenibacillus turpanensis TaxID=2689078 RepID=UPI00140C3FC1|nr:hypothetical protein [Paenibacillus turpanensis]
MNKLGNSKLRTDNKNYKAQKAAAAKSYSETGVLGPRISKPDPLLSAGKGLAKGYFGGIATGGL